MMYLFSAPCTSPINGNTYSVRFFMSMEERAGLIEAGIIPLETSLVEALYDELGKPIAPSALGILAPIQDQQYLC